MIVTLAGHVDHGKTSLVRCLTGQDTDRLAEEKRRGLTINLGFAYIRPGSNPLGFVDVPGHHRFIHNMVAGVASMQYALLVVAADDGPMPQSREHLQILQLSGVSRGAIALTKCDRVAEDRQMAAEAETRALCAGTFLDGAPLFRTSATTGSGIADLLDHLVETNEHYVAAAPRRTFRLAVDRAFSIKGTGLVVTGTVHGGSVALEDELTVFPGGERVRVRGLHTQNQEASTAAFGDRCALNLTGISLERISRGSWLSATPTTGHTQLAVQLDVLADYPRPVRHWSPVHVYHATTHTTARLALLQDKALQPGTSALVDLVLDEPLLAIHGDRLVLRDQSLDRTLGGGPVIVNFRRDQRRRSVARLAELRAYALAEPQRCFVELLSLGAVPLDIFADCWGLLPEDLDELIEQAPCTVQNGHAIANDLWQEWLQQTLKEVERRHAADNSLQGLTPNELAQNIAGHFQSDVLRALVTTGKLTERSGRYLPPTHEVELSEAEAALFQSVKAHLDQPQPVSAGDLAKQLQVPLGKLHKELAPLVGKRRLIRVSANRYYLPEQMQPLVAVADRLNEASALTVRGFRDAAGIGRNTAIEVLEYLDARGYTKRSGDTRRVVGDRSRLFGP